MSRPIARTLGALALAAALATSSTAVFAVATHGDPAFYATKKTTTLGRLSPELRTSAVQKARSMSNATKLGAEGGTSQSGPSDTELDLICGDDWFITWDEDADGNPILGTFHLHCGGTDIQIG
jgi:hypothetical protein